MVSYHAKSGLFWGENSQIVELFCDAPYGEPVCTVEAVHEGYCATEE